MTLTTAVRVDLPCSVTDVYLHCRFLLDTPHDVAPEYGADAESGLAWVAHSFDVGLPARLCVFYKSAVGSLESSIEVTFDTVRSYRGRGRESCFDLHARLVTALGRWLDVKGLPWQWYDERHDVWSVRFDGLAVFGDAHRAFGSVAWFRRAATEVDPGA